MTVPHWLYSDDNEKKVTLHTKQHTVRKMCVVRTWQMKRQNCCSMNIRNERKMDKRLKWALFYFIEHIFLSASFLIWADFVKILEFRNLSNLNKPAKNVYHSLDIFVTWVWFQLWKLILTIKHVLAHLYLLYWFLINKAKFINLFMGRMHSIDSVQVLWIKKNSYKK